ncbi:TetR/AcrR family transcriptional regulator [Pyruvatibacter sp.]|uniref:TetR/AcrR family transcriptional regulator n=1 Tax=Pyruvatibacter sp. TaxID=1981328 RepID=UPI0032651DDE
MKDASEAPRFDVRTVRTREQIELAALEIFAELGFEGASTRQIAARAGVKQQLLSYHYKNKLGLWKATADRLFGACRERFEQRLAGLEGVDEATQTRLLLKEYLVFCSENPELARFMMQVGATPSERLSWLYEHHTRGLLELVANRIGPTRKALGLADADVHHLTYLLMGASAMFSQRAEYEMVAGQKVDDPDVVARFADLVVEMLLGGPEGVG